MKKLITALSVGIVLLLSAVSCNKRGPEDFPVIFGATATFKPQTDGSYFIKVDEDHALIVVNPSELLKYPFKKPVEKRAFINYTISETAPEGTVRPSGVDKFKNVNYASIVTIDTIQTKNPVPSRDDNDKAYGKDPMGLFIGKDIFPTTLIEDGYLNVCFTITRNKYDIKHDINLVAGENPEDPYEVVIRHNAHEDYGGEPVGYYLINFPLKDLPDTKGEKVKLTLKWNSITSGSIESATFDYVSRTDW